MEITDDHKPFLFDHFYFPPHSSFRIYVCRLTVGPIHKPDTVLTCKTSTVLSLDLKLKHTTRKTTFFLFFFWIRG